MSSLRACLPRRALLLALWAAFVPPALAQTPQAAPPEDRILVQAWPDMEAVISSTMTGQVVQLPSRIGARFGRGDVLVRFDCTENQAKVAIALSEVTVANENLEAKLRLQGMKAASEIEVKTAAAQVAKAEAQLNLAKHQVDQCTIRAPYAGFVVRTISKPHQTATQGQPLLEIISAGAPRLKLSANSKWFKAVRPGTPLLVSMDETGRSYPATVTSINARIDPVNQSFEMEARLQGNPAGLMPGMSGTAVIANPQLAAASPAPAARREPSPPQAAPARQR